MGQWLLATCIAAAANRRNINVNEVGRQRFNVVSMSLVSRVISGRFQRVCEVYSHGRTHSSRISIPKPGASDGMIFPSTGIAMPGIGTVSSNGMPGAVPSQNSWYGDSGAAIAKC